MNIRNSTRSTIGRLLFFGILIMAGFLPGCQTAKENARPEKIINPNGRNDVWVNKKTARSGFFVEQPGGK